MSEHQPLRLPAPSPVERPRPGLPRIMLRNRTLIASIVGGCLAIAAVYLLFATKQWTAMAQIKIEQNSPRTIGADVGGDSEESKQSFLNTQRAVMLSVKVLNDAVSRDEVRDLNLLRKIRNRVAYLREAVRIEVGRKANIVLLEVDAPARKEAETLLNGIIEAYKDNEALRKKRVSTDLLAILQKELDTCDVEISKRTIAMLKLRQEAGTLSFDRSDSVVVRQLQALKDAVTAVNIEVTDAESTYRAALAAYPTTTEAQDLLVQTANTSQIFMADALEAGQLRQTIRDTEAAMETALAVYGPEHPRVVAIRQLLNQRKAMYVVGNKQRCLAALAKRQSLDESLREQQKLAAHYGELEADHAKLVTEVQRLDRQADALMERMKQVAADERAAGLNIEVVQEPYTEDYASKPAKARVAGIALMAGILLGIIAAYGREAFNPRMYQADDVQMSLGLPVLGTVPRMTGNQTDAARSQKMRYDPLSEAAEAFRIVRMALLASAHGDARTFLVTSPAEDDGKTTLACNLAIAMAKAGERTLLIDAHFERPQQHRVFDITSRFGLTAILTNGESLESAAQPSPIDRLDILPCGPSVENPVDLLNSDQFAQFMEEMSRRYDRVIIDSSAVLEGSEPRVIASVADATVLVVRVGRTTRRQCEQAYDGLLSVGARLGGVVVNDVVRPHAGTGRNGALGKFGPLPPRHSLRPAERASAGLLGQRGNVLSDSSER